MLCVQGLQDLDTAVKYYKEVLKYDATCVEAIACTATHFFYSEQPEIALRYYRSGQTLVRPVEAQVEALCVDRQDWHDIWGARVWLCVTLWGSVWCINN